MKPSLFSFLAVLVLTSATHSRALQAETPASTITSRANLVVVPVVVTGKHGNHMANLTKDDFRVEEEGKAQPIARFEEISANKTPMHRATGPVPNSYTNEVVGDPSSRVLVIIALDFLNTTVPMTNTLSPNQTAVNTLFLILPATTIRPMAPICDTRSRRAC